MKIIETAKKALKSIVFDVEKDRAGVYISRPLLQDNAQKWHDWGTKWGIPGLLPPEEMHVTILHSVVDVRPPLIETTLNIPTSSMGCFALFGPTEACLVFTFLSWELKDRNWSLLDLGAVSSWPTYRPHLTLSMDVGDFELSDDALKEVPAYIVLGPEQSAGLKVKDDPSDQVDGDDDSAIEVAVLIIECAEKLLKTDGDKMSVMSAYDLADVAKGRATKSVMKRIAAADWAPPELKAAMATPADVRKRVEVDYTVSIAEIPDEIAKKFNASDIAKTNDDEQIVMGIASVSTVEGELLKDLHGDKVKTRALVEFNRSLISGSRAGKFDHEGSVCTEVVAGLVLTEDWQKSLGIDLGFEPYLVEIHVPDPVDWAEVKKGDWMLSIAGKMWFYEDADADV